MRLTPLLFFCTAFLWHSTAWSQSARPTDPELEEILSLDISELTVTSVAKRAQKLSDAPAAVYVLTHEDLHRSGATTIPEALRMVPGLDVAQAGSNRWAVGSRGINTVLSDKLLVMIDGRSIYTPIYSGVYWDDQSTLLEDVDRIEVIRGPGASLWGANAVNGIINIITKRASETQGNYVAALAGNQEAGVEGRHGGVAQNGDFYRVYSQYQQFGRTENLNEETNPDQWYRVRSGFRVDGRAASGDNYTVSGDVYGGEQEARSTIYSPAAPFSRIAETDNTSFGGNVLGRWNHRFSEDSNASIQAYVDHYTRDEATAEQHVSTADMQVQHNLKLNERNNFVWGGGARGNYQDVNGTFSAYLRNHIDSHYIFNTFAQDEYALILDKLYFTFGSKFEYNDYTGFEIEPSARLSWHPTPNQTVWGAVSRAVRTPSAIEHDANLAFAITPGAPPTVSRYIGNPDLDSERVIAYELGYRIQPSRKLSFDTTAFIDDYNALQTLGIPGATFTDQFGTIVTPFVTNSQGKGQVYGAEFVANWKPSKEWKLSGSYTYSTSDFEVDPGTSFNLRGFERSQPRSQFSIRSFWNVTDTLQWDNMLYYVSSIAAPASEYLRYDTRLGWQVTPGLEASLIGRNLLDAEHPEFAATPRAEIPRSALIRLGWKF